MLKPSLTRLSLLTTFVGLGAAASFSVFPGPASAAPTVFNLIGSPVNLNTISPATNSTSGPYTLTTGSGAVVNSLVGPAGSVSLANIQTAFLNFSPDFTTDNDLFSGSGTTSFTLVANPVALAGGPVGTLITFSPSSKTGSQGNVWPAAAITSWNFTTDTGYTGSMNFSFLSQGTTSTQFSWSAQSSINDPNPVPGPLPILGAGSAFAWSRRLRKRVSSAS